jgi:hypothetical protein
MRKITKHKIDLPVEYRNQCIQDRLKCFDDGDLNVPKNIGNTLRIHFLMLLEQENLTFYGLGLTFLFRVKSRLIKFIINIMALNLPLCFI